MWTLSHRRDWIFSPHLLEELKKSGDTDRYSMMRVPRVDGRKWQAHGVHNSILVEHKSE